MNASIEKQKLSIQKQAASVIPSAAPSGGEPGFFAVAWPAPPQWSAGAASAADCEAMPQPQLDQLVQAASQKQGLQAELVRAVIGKESGARPCALSAKGAQGLMQLMPSTAQELGIGDPFDPQQNIDGGTRLLKQLLTKYNGDVSLALGAYNAGAGRVDREGGIPQIPETVSYVSDILSRFRIQ
jgi:soluble lytic murein transglycosylase-like protein